LEKRALRLEKVDIEILLNLTETLPEELHGNRGFSRTGVALNQIKVIASEASAKNVVKAGNARGK
jgi:hypothetical protein